MHQAACWLQNRQGRTARDARGEPKGTAELDIFEPKESNVECPPGSMLAADPPGNAATSGDSKGTAQRCSPERGS